METRGIEVVKPIVRKKPLILKKGHFITDIDLHFTKLSLILVNVQKINKKFF